MEKAAAASTGFPLGTICLIFWAIVHFGAPLGTTWGGISAHTAAYVALWIGVLGPLAILGVIIALALVVMGIVAAVS